MTLPAIGARATLTVRETSARMTPAPASRRFGEVLAQSGRAVLEGALSAANFVPGANLVAAAVRGVGSASPLQGMLGSGSMGPGSAPIDGPIAGGVAGTGSVGGSTGGTGSSGLLGNQGDNMLAQQQEMSIQMLQLQEAVGNEDRRYTALSNVLKARHDMAKNAIGNIR